MPPRGLRPHTHEARERIARHLLDGWKGVFGDRLVAVAATASFARGDDRAYSDLEFVVFLQEAPGPESDSYFQRVYEGLLVEAEYVTEASYLERYRVLPCDWYLSGGAPLEPLLNASFVGRVRQARDAITYPEEAFLLRAAERFLDVQESFGKVLSAVSHGARGGLALLLADAVIHALATLAFLNRRPFTTFAAFLSEGRALPEKPPRLGALLDLVEEGRFDDLVALRAVTLDVFAGFEAMFEARGYTLYDDDLDPARPNKRYTLSQSGGSMAGGRGQHGRGVS